MIAPRSIRWLLAASIVATSTVALAQKPGTHKRTLESDRQEREYLLHIPRGFKPRQEKPRPLVLMLHGRTSNGRAAASRYYGWKQLADKEGFVVAFPTALGSPTSWQGAWRGKPTNDSRFLAKLIDSLVAELRLDPNRVYMTGHSSGGFMSYSFAATHSDKVAAIGPVAGLAIGRTKPQHPVAVISFHGMADKVVAYDKVHGKRAIYKGMPSAIESAKTFADHYDCDAVKRTSVAKGTVHVDTWANGKDDSEVVLYSIENGDHGWPRSRRGSIDATDLIWKFFEKHARRPKNDRAQQVPKKNMSPSKKGRPTKVRREAGKGRTQKTGEKKNPPSQSNKNF